MRIDSGVARTAVENLPVAKGDGHAGGNGRRTQDVVQNFPPGFVCSGFSGSFDRWGCGPG